MIIQFSPFVLLYLAAVAIGLFFLLLTQKLPDSPGKRPMQAVVLGTVIWSAAYSVELSSADLGTNLAATLIEYLGILIITPALLLFVLCYTGRDRYVTRNTLVLLMTVPALTFLALLTNPSHLLYYTSVTPYTVGDLILFLYEYGPLFWVAICYSYLLTAFSVSILILALMDYPVFYRPQITLVIIATLLPVLTSVVYITKLGPFPGLQITPVVFTLVGGVLVFASVKHHLFTILPRTQCRIPEYLTDGILITDDAGRVIYMNPAAEACLLVNAPEAIGQNIVDILPLSPAGDGIVEFKSPDGALLEVTRLTIKESGALGRISILHDISHQRRAEIGLREANRQLSLLSSVTRHDILNQITVVQGCIELSRDISPGPEYERYLAIMKTATDRIQSEIEFTRIYQDLGTQEPQWLELSSIIKAPCCIRLSIDCSGYVVYADPMLPKVFENLFDNAKRHGERVTEISISCDVVERTLRITVSDDGAGIPEEEKEKIFARGYGKNTGFGLFLVRDILAITGIAIHEDGTFGAGARFVILVPDGGWKGDQG
ncbi:MAG: histidine kinase N-terminal 7TM domain-containing protein [Methanocalculus sp.]|uniref:histidine kinase N-terminal 7TM domain-containing protein n=1 Tax=Methanocalculus sp. TaxID=2004547 RepID=UPI00271ED9C4|nr:histidine kinase N-terminal 7TM domain-containing protein [Methanocalculus sp.]MDO9540235.1 histidine kinase N-terminal 7TM domain-containing protein [Methanocalculus sp.]